MIDMPQATPPAVIEAARSNPPPVIDLMAPDRCTTPDAGEVVVCGHPLAQGDRLRPLTPPLQKPGFLQRPHVLKIAPNVSLGLLGDGKGAGLRAEF